MFKLTKTVALESSEGFVIVHPDEPNYKIVCVSNSITLNDKPVYKSADTIVDIRLLPIINLLLIVHEHRMVILNLESLRVVEKLALDCTGIETWNNSGHYEANNSDMLSLATSFQLKQDEEETSIATIDESDLITCIGIISTNQITVLKWKNDVFVDKYNLFLKKITNLKFVSCNDLVCINSSNSLIEVNLKKSKIVHRDLMKGLNLTKEKSIFWNNLMIENFEIFDDNSKLVVIFKNGTVIYSKYPQFEQISRSAIQSFTSSYISNLLIFLVFKDKIQIRSLLNFKLFQEIEASPEKVTIFPSSFQFIDSKQLRIDELLPIDQVLQSFDTTDYVNLIEFTKASDLNPEMKFNYLRKFNIDYALSIMEEDFTRAIGIATNYLALPTTILRHLPNKVKTAIDDANVDDHTEDEEISSLIDFLVDSRRKLGKFQNGSKYFKLHDTKISLEFFDEIENLDDALVLIDNYLFKCYLKINRKLLAFFLRLPNYCDEKLIDKECTAFKLFDQLIDFYFKKRKFENCFKILNKQNRSHEPLITRLLNLNEPPLDLILRQINADNFEKVFMDLSLDYSNIDYYKVLNYAKNKPTLYVSFLEFLIFDLEIHENKLISCLFEVYLQDIDLNFEGLEKLLKIGNYNAVEIIDKLKLYNTPRSKKLMILPLFKLNKFDEILSIYIFELKEYPECIEFCLHLPDKSLSKRLILKLLELDLSFEVYEIILINILRSDLHFIEFDELIGILNSDVSVRLVNDYLTKNLKKLTVERNSLIIKSDLLKINTINKSFEKNELENEYVKLDAKSTCEKCGKNFSNTEILCFTKDNKMIHYNCSKKV